MRTRAGICLSLMLPLLVCGCDRTRRAELERMREELEATRAELSRMRAYLAEHEQHAAVRSYLDELEKLDSLKTKGALTQEEFDRQKQAILERKSTAPTAGQQTHAPGMDELAQQLRTLESLYQRSTITLQERDAKRAQLIARPLHVINFKKDLETVQTLYNTSVITLQERDTLKKKILEFDQSGSS